MHINGSNGNDRALGRREWIASYLGRPPLAGLVLRARARARIDVLTVLTYHRIVPADALHNDFDDGVIDATAAQLDRQLADVARHFSVVGIDDLCAAQEGAPLPPNPLVISFDDGYRECLHVVLPILERHGLRAVFFIPTGYVDRRRMFWWDKIAFAVKHARNPVLRLRYPWPLEAEAAPVTAERFSRIVKHVRGLDVDRFVAEIMDAAGVEWDEDREHAMASRLILDWDEVCALADAGMGVESHTVTHRVLDTMSRAECSRELLESRVRIEQRLGRPVCAIAYPCGRDFAGDRELRSMIARAGYRFGFANRGGVNYRWRRRDALNLQRIATERELPDAMFRAVLAVPALGHSRA